MICHQCGNEQEKGNFCGKCGAKLNNDPNLQETAGGGGDQVSINRNPQPSYGQAASTQMNEHVEKGELPTTYASLRGWGFKRLVCVR
ncbi:hypothetical protein NSR00_13665 [Aeribacillus sp. FSL K6-8394]|uniref:hypothetical protein n=1 Tax=Aeribacillus sp. FSL K6-8394 TaxID=2954570 RepID=UPI0030F65143